MRKGPPAPPAPPSPKPPTPPPPPPPPPGPCASAADCQLNGRCSGGRCECDSGWTGHSCQQLDLLPATVDAGLQDPKMSSWGGSVLQNKSDGAWHMFAAVIENGCGLAAWRPNSALGHAVSRTGPTGPYRLVSGLSGQYIKPHFAHEPVAVMAADGTILIYHIGAGKNETGPGSNYAANCSEPQHCTGADHKWTGGGTFYGPTSILYSKSFEGPWQSQVAGFGSKVAGCPTCGDTNPAPIIKPDGSVEMMWRTTSMMPEPGTVGKACPGGSCMAMAAAPTWKGPYSWDRSNIFRGQPHANHTHIEDAHLFVKPARGVANPGSYHAIFHSDVEHNSVKNHPCCVPLPGHLCC